MTAKSHLRQSIENFVAHLPPEAALHRLIESSEIQSRLDAFDRADAVAIAKQKQYRGAGWIALMTMSFSVVLGALVLLPLEPWLGLDGQFSRVVSVAQTLTLVLAMLGVLWIALREPVDQWMQARAQAEAIRGDVFRSILQGGVAAADPAKLLQEKLACFKHAHLDSQLAYFRKRGDEAHKSCGRATPLRVAGYALTIVAVLFGAAAGIMWVSRLLGTSLWSPVQAAIDLFRVADAHRWQLGLGTIASSVLAFASARSLMDQDERNSTCYRVAVDQLDKLIAASLASAQQAAAQGDETAVSVFTDRVQGILDAENLAWMYARPPDDPRAI
jgi:hypothetical protein